MSETHSVPSPAQSSAPTLRPAEIVAIALFLGANLLVPFLWGDIFPFTSAPMFRDAPRAYCIYRVFGPDGKELAAEEFLLQRIYDGNPPGYGVGIEPPATLARFGEIATEEEIRLHVLEQLAANPKLKWVSVEQDIVCCVDGCCTVKETKRFRVERVAP